MLAQVRGKLEYDWTGRRQAMPGREGHILAKAELPTSVTFYATNLKKVGNFQSLLI
jgi:hypothetical protein